MKQQQFEQRHLNDWLAFEAELQRLEHRRPLDKPAEFPACYRKLRRHLALAEARHYNDTLVSRLQSLALRGQRQLYRQRLSGGLRLAGFITSDFPRLVREQWRSLALASMLFYLPTFACALLVTLYPELAWNLAGQAHLQQLEQMYDPAQRLIGPMAERGSNQDWQMFAFYILNNIGVGFQTFVGGLAFGIGTLFYLFYNGVLIGTSAGHMIVVGYSETFFTFVAAHSAFELTAITLAGAAGLQLARALLMPGRLTRRAALRHYGSIAVRMMAGMILLLLIAAFVEAYWSSINSFPAWLKYGVGVICWILMTLYFVYGGRRGAVA